MSTKLNSVFFLLFLVASCSNETGTKSESSVTQGLPTDSISKVDIIYYPAFNNRSILHLDRSTGFGTFKVDTTTTFPYEVPRLLFNFSLNDLAAKTSIAHFWDEKFLQSLQIKSQSGVRDGMSIWIFYCHGQHKDSVDLGNNYSQSVDSMILEQLNYINENTKDKTMKVYINQLKEYL